MTPTPTPLQPTKNDDEHLKLLAIMHYVLGGFGYLGSLLSLIYIVLGVAMASGKMDGGKNPPPAAMGWMFAGVGVALLLGGIAASSALIYAGKSLTARKRWLFCFVVSIVICVMCSPFGTVLGIFTIIVLLRPTVKAAFGQL